MKCPTCGCETCDASSRPVSNRPEPYMMAIPREMLPVMVGLLRQMSTKMVMHGYGHVAHMVSDMAIPLREATPAWLLRFAWSPESLAQAIKAKRLGHKIVVAEADGKIGVVAYEGEKRRVMLTCGVKEGETADEVIILLENFFESIEVKEKNDVE